MCDAGKNERCDARLMVTGGLHCGPKQTLTPWKHMHGGSLVGCAGRCYIEPPSDMHDDMWVHAYDRLLVAQVDAIIAWNHLHRTTVQYDICSVTC